MNSTNISLNVIPLKLEESSKRFSFFKYKPNDSFVPLTREEMPIDLGDLQKGILYTDFSENKGSDFTFEVDFTSSRHFAKHYMNHLIYQWFENKARLRKIDYVRNNEFYFLENEDQENGLAHFERYKVRGGYGRITDGFELTVMYAGKMSVWLKPVYAYGGSSTDFKTVVYNGGVHKYEDLIQEKGVSRKEMYPVLNRDLRETLGIPFPAWTKINRTKQHTDKIDWFYNEFVRDEEFAKAFRPSEDGFITIDPSHLNRLESEAANLLFGDNVIEKNPHEGIKKGGPYEPPRVSHIRIFFICSEQDAKTTGNMLYKNLRDGKSFFPGLNKYARTPVHISDQHITFTDSGNPFPEIRNQLQTMKMDEDIRYCAIYISPIHKGDPDPKKHRVYYRVKEELLKYGITSQVIHHESIHKPDFSYYLTNISIALVAKLDGIPWTLEQEKREELVIGVGAYSPHRKRKTYLGSAFCFSNSGDFRGFNSFTADDHLMLAGSFQKAIKQFKDENDTVERVIIHFYKRMNRKESNMIKQVLKELDLDVPVVILTIHKSGSQDLVLSDRDKTHRLPLSGTWMRSGRRQFLLCNNTRFDEPDDKIRSHPLPVKVFFDLGGEPPAEYEGNYYEWLDTYLAGHTWVEELLEQVYRFSRLNWQTITVKSLPVTVQYPEMVAKKFPYFDGDVIPEFGKRNFWFL